MPRDQPLTLRGSVAAPAAPDGELVLMGDVAQGGAAELVITGTVSTAMRDAVTGNDTAHGYVIRLAGVDVPEDDLVGAVEISDELDSVNSTLRFMVRGLDHSMARTLSTWTRVPVEAVGYHGLPGEEIPRIEFRGYLVPGSGQQRGVIDPELGLVADTSAILGDGPVCAEIPPGAGLTRSQIAAAVVGTVPVTAPGGEVFGQGLIVVNQTRSTFLSEWGQAAGWSWRFNPAADPGFVTLEGFTADVKTLPDEIWTADDCEVIDLEPPSSPVSKVVVRGVSTVNSVTEGGVEIEVRTVELRQPYALKVADEEQSLDGSIASVSSNSSESLRLVQKLETETHRFGGRELAVITREYGYGNPRSARIRTKSGGEPEGPDDGYYPTRSWIAEGEYRFWRRERWIQKSERRICNVYDNVTDTLKSQEIEDYRWHSRTAGVRRIDAGVPGPWVVDVGVGTDDQSYKVYQTDNRRLRIDTYGLAERHRVTYRYNDATGAEAGSNQVSEGYYAPRGAVDVDNHFSLFDGRGQIEITASLRVVRELETANGLTEDGRLISEAEAVKAWHGLTKRDGAHDWGGGLEFSNRVSEIFRLKTAKVTIYRRQGDGSAERIVFSTDEAPSTTRIPDSTIPLPRFGDSAWTRAREAPFEHVVTDPVAESLWGSASQVVESSYTSVAEADRIGQRILRRSRPLKVRVRRLETLVRPGDTVRIIDPHQGLDDLALLVERRRRLELQTGANLGEYVLEVYP